MISEIIIGRRSGNSPINAMRLVARDSNSTSAWQIVGWSGIAAGIGKLRNAVEACYMYHPDTEGPFPTSKKPASC